MSPGGEWHGVAGGGGSVESNQLPAVATIQLGQLGDFRLFLMMEWWAGVGWGVADESCCLKCAKEIGNESIRTNGAIGSALPGFFSIRERMHSQ